MTEWRNLPGPQRKALARLRRGPSNAHLLECSITTIAALQRKKLVHVDTTFDNIAYPRQALAKITEEGRNVLSGGECARTMEK